jgi:hypothetical protein
MVDSRIVDNGGIGAIIHGGSGKLVKCKFDRNAKGILKKESGCKVSCSHNIAPASILARHPIPGFQAMSNDATAKVTARD